MTKVNFLLGKQGRLAEKKKEDQIVYLGPKFVFILGLVAPFLALLCAKMRAIAADIAIVVVVVFVVAAVY